MARVRCYMCHQEWDSGKEVEPAEWVEVGESSWRPICPPCYRAHFPDVPRRSAQNTAITGPVQRYVGYTTYPAYTPPVKREVLPLDE